MTNFEIIKEAINKMSVEDFASAIKRKIGKDMDICFDCPTKDFCKAFFLTDLCRLSCARQIEKWLNAEVKIKELHCCPCCGKNTTILQGVNICFNCGQTWRWESDTNE